MFEVTHLVLFIKKLKQFCRSDLTSDIVALMLILGVNGPSVVSTNTIVKSSMCTDLKCYISAVAPTPNPYLLHGVYDQPHRHIFFLIFYTCRRMKGYRNTVQQTGRCRSQKTTTISTFPTTTRNLASSSAPGSKISERGFTIRTSSTGSLKNWSVLSKM